MDANDRIKILRKQLDLTQAEFGEKIGMKQAVIGQMENGSRNLTDRTILLICDKYKVQEAWLRDGTGEMFSETDSTILSQLSEEYQLDLIDQKIIEAFLKLKPEQRKTVQAYAMNLVESLMVDYEKLREAYTEQRALPFAAAGGDVSGLDEAAQLYDNSQEEEGE